MYIKYFHCTTMTNGLLYAMKIYDEIDQEKLEDHDLETQRLFVKSVVILKDFLRSHGRFQRELTDDAIYDLGILARLLDEELFNGPLKD